MKVVIIKYNAGNVQSVSYALQRLGIAENITDDIEEIKSADKIIFPGVGNAASAMRYLQNNKLDVVIKNLTQPVLGICLGLQLLCRKSEEGNTKCLEVFDIDVKKFISNNYLKIPQMGWNNIYNLSSLLFKDVKDNSFMYFVHSYYAELSPQTIATTDYTLPYSAAIKKDNFYGVQFHAEKSADVGARIISNFIQYT